MHPLLDPLTEPQREAATHVEGPLLILAGPGSGKTRVITHRIAYLLEQGASSREILALTFTNKAADEMRARVDELAPGHRAWLSTFHRFGAQLLRGHAELVGLTPNFTIYDATDARQTLRRVIDAEQIATQNYSPERIAAAISAAKNKLITCDEYQPRSSSPLSRVVAKAYPAYQRRLLDSSAVDFDDLLLHVAKLLYDHPEVRQELDERYKFVMVDEYQDTNRAQYVILRALSVDYPNLAVTGDPDQSIYGWRGADLNNILEFEADYPNVRIVRLERNYRSTKRILRIADALISRNVMRKPKALFTENDEGRPVRMVVYADQDAEADGIVGQIRAAIEAGERSPSDFAVFYRVNALTRSLESAFRRGGVPFQIIRGQEFYARQEIKDVLAYCQLLCNPRDDMAFERAIAAPPRGVGKKSLERLVQQAYTLGVPLLEAARQASQIEGLSKRPASQLEGFVAMIDGLSQLAAENVEDIIRAVLEQSGYPEYLRREATEEDLNRLANIEELLTDAGQFDNKHPGGGHLEAYLEQTWLVNETDDWDTAAEKVTLMTLHAAKGLEFPVVFMVALEDSILPHERVRDDMHQLEEERRLAFVGITRAKEELQLSRTLRRYFRGMRRITVPSTFLFELPQEELDWIEEVPAGRPLRSRHRRADGDEVDAYHDESGEFDDGLQEAADQIQWELSDASLETAEGDAGEPQFHLAAAGVTTAAALAGGGDSEQAAMRDAPRLAPDEWQKGMTCVHPDLGPGKIVATSGVGKNRRATVRFATAGERRYVLAHAPLIPVGR